MTSGFGRIGTAYAFDDGSIVDLDEDAERRASQDPGRPLVRAACEGVRVRAGRAARRCSLAQPTPLERPSSSNVELLLELVGDADKIGIESLCGGTEDEPGLRSLFATFQRSKDEPEDEDAEPSRLDGIRRAIAVLDVTGRVEPSGDGWAVTYRTEEALPSTAAARVECWPLASSGNRREVAGGEPLEGAFRGYSRDHQRLPRTSRSQTSGIG